MIQKSINDPGDYRCDIDSVYNPALFSYKQKKRVNKYLYLFFIDSILKFIDQTVVLITELNSLSEIIT